MSTQLILYPQNYKGAYNSTFFNASEMLVDGSNFTNINAASGVTGDNNGGDVLINQPPNIINTWYKSRQFAGMSYPTTVSGNLEMYGLAGATSSFTSVYQRLSGLVVGGSYKVTILCQPANAISTVHIVAVNGTNLNAINGAGANANITSLDGTFIAQTSQDVVMVFFRNGVVGPFLDDVLVIENISVKQLTLGTTGIYTNLENGQVICDLYQDEDIPLTLSIDEFKNVAETVQSYSKDFNLPATKRNNQIFNNMFEVTRADDGLIFNPYVQTKCVLKQDGFILFEGYLRMINIKDKEGQISYNVNLYSEVIAVADVLKNRTFADLDFTELEHDYNRLNIVASWTGAPTYLQPNTSSYRGTKTLKYPFINWNQQFYAAATLELETLEVAFRPCIQIKYLIDRIFADTGFTYSSDFFNTPDFKKLYMDFNWGDSGNADDFNEWGSANITSAFGQTFNTTWTHIATDTDNFGPNFGYNNTAGWTCQYDNATVFMWAWFFFRPDGADDEFHHRWLHTEAATGNTYVYGQDSELAVITSTSPSWNWRIESDVTLTMNTGDTLQWQGMHTGPSGAYVAVPSTLPIDDEIDQYRGNISVDVITSGTLLQNLRGELGQWDFIKGIITMFNLITLKDETNLTNILIEPYKDVFIKTTNQGNNNQTLANRGITHDWTDKVDVSQMELKPLTDLNEITSFKFVEDDDDYAFNVFKQAQNGHLYGSLVHSASGFTILEGEKEIIAEPFAATVVKELIYGMGDFVVPAVYARNDDNTWEGFDNAPRILYDNGVRTLMNDQYTMPAQNGTTGLTTSDFLQFSHLSDVPSSSISSKDFVFNSSQLASANVGVPPIDNLFYTYWQPYFNELYNADTRIMILKVNLTPSDIATFKFTDSVMIKNRSFRVNKIEYKPNSLARVEFILIP